MSSINFTVSNSVERVANKVFLQYEVSLAFVIRVLYSGADIMTCIIPIECGILYLYTSGVDCISLTSK